MWRSLNMNHPPPKKNAFDQTDLNMLSTPVANIATIMHIYWLQYYDIQSWGLHTLPLKEGETTFIWTFAIGRILVKQWVNLISE